MQGNAASGDDHQRLADAKARVDAHSHAYGSRRWKILGALRTPGFSLLRAYARPQAGALVLLTALNLAAVVLEALRLLTLFIVLGMLVGETAIRDGTVVLAGFELPLPFVQDLEGTRGLALALLAFSILTVAKEGTAFASAYLAIRVQSAITFAVRRDLMDKVLRLSLSYFSGARSGDVSYLQNTVVNRLTQLLPMLQQVTASVLDLVVAVGIMLFISTRLTLVLAGLSLALFALVGLMRKRTSRLSYETEVASREASTFFLDAIQGIRLVKLAGRNGRTRETYVDLSRRQVARTVRQQAFQELALALTRTGSIAVLLIAAFGLYLVARTLPQTNAGIGLGFVYVAYRAVTDFSLIAAARLRLASFVPQFTMVADFLLDERQEEQAHGGRKLAGAPSRLELDRVSFAYDERRLVLDRVSLAFDRGTATALVGASGSGKTTILELLAGFQRPSTGFVRVDGNDLAELDLDDYRRRIGYAGQETVLFHTSVLDNIRFLRPDARDDEVAQAIARAQADDFVGAGLRQVDEIVGERGQRLSGGQRQRIALARVLLQDPSILLLDEATNALDVRTETSVFENLLALREEGKILVAAAHRLTSLVAFDRIVVLHDGRVHESGTHDELMAERGFYYHLFELQRTSPQSEFLADEV